MGTPDFALPCLQRLIENDQWNLRLVVTQPDRPAGRGKKLQAPPIKVLAEKFQIPVLQPTKLREDPEALDQILNTPCDFLVVVAFGQILPKGILDHPKVAPLNVHASLLPAYRGAAPIARSIMEEENKTGVSIQWMVKKLDMGDVLYQIPCTIEENDTAADLHDKLKILGAQALVHCLELFKKDQIERHPQTARVGSYASKLQKEESKISFKDRAIAVHRKIMGMNPWPVAECQLLGTRLRIFRSQFLPRPADAEPGTVLEVGEQGIIVACIEGCVALLELQMENRKQLPVADFLRGHPLPTGLILGNKS